MTATVLTERGPMDFTRHEFWRGVWASWCIFLLSMTVALITVGLVESGPPFGPPGSSIAVLLIYGVPIGGVISLVVMLLGAPLAWGLGRLLAKTESVAVHLLVYAALGVVVGASVIVIPQLLNGSDGLVLATPFALAIMSVCAVSVAGGWAWIFARSRAERSA